MEQHIEEYDFKTVQDAMNYIAEKYIFDRRHYPDMDGLFDHDPRECFVAKHCILHILKSYPLVLKYCISQEKNPELITAMRKIGVNVLAIAIALRIPGNKMEGEILSRYVTYEPDNEPPVQILQAFTDAFGRVATHYEQIDHGHQMKWIGNSVIEMFTELVILHRSFFAPKGMEEFVNGMPGVMKSK